MAAVSAPPASVCCDPVDPSLPSALSFHLNINLNDFYRFFCCIHVNIVLSFSLWPYFIQQHYADLSTYGWGEAGLHYSHVEA